MSTHTSRTTAFLLGMSDGSWCDIYPLHTEPRVTVGRSGGNNIVVLDEKASRLHCKVVWRHNDWHVCDVGSRNGTYVNGLRVTGCQVLNHGDRLTVASRELMFSTDITESNSELDMDTHDRPTASLHNENTAHASK